MTAPLFPNVEDEKWWKQCGKKRRYFSEAEAVRRATMTQHDDDRLIAYRCPHGPHWHIGHDREEEQAS